ncbi:MAG: hypothetical protein PF572_05510 [Patescibacteria group bacterium]|jgi:hypothetical protein|nr:hypothetical protein [Patescibacteria group bacterium]
MKKILVLSFAFIFALTPLFSINLAFAAGPELLINGGFEEPVVTSAENWDIYPDGTGGLGWSVVWNGPFGTSPANLEIHRNADATAPEGMQYAELDSDYDGPTGSINNEEANISISQSIETCEGGEYILSYSWIPRAANGPHSMEVEWGGDVVGTHTGILNDFPVWQNESVVLVGNGGLMTIAFSEIASADSFGTYLDDVSLMLVEGTCGCDSECNSGSDVVINDNEAFVMNRVSSSANTGGNTAGGSYGGDGGDAGDIRTRGDVNQSSTGNGGVGGDGNTGGTVYTGNAYASTSLYSEVNSNTSSIDRCSCGGDDCCDEGHVVVYNRNRAIVMNDASSWANTGDNMAEGSYAGRGGDGGTINPEDRFMPRPAGVDIEEKGAENGDDDDGRVDESMTGEGGAGGNAGAGGLVETGESRSSTTYVNVVNRNLTRILR